MAAKDSFFWGCIEKLSWLFGIFGVFVSIYYSNQADSKNINSESNKNDKIIVKPTNKSNNTPPVSQTQLNKEPYAYSQNTIKDQIIMIDIGQNNYKFNQAPFRRTVDGNYLDFLKKYKLPKLVYVDIYIIGKNQMDGLSLAENIKTVSLINGYKSRIYVDDSQNVYENIGKVGFSISKDSTAFQLYIYPVYVHTGL